MRRVFRTWWFGVLFCGTLGLTIVLFGIGTLLRGQVHYQNYWGGEVFAPFAIVLGSVFAVVGAWKWRTLFTTEPKPVAKLSRKARRAAERAERVEFPIETYEKW